MVSLFRERSAIGVFSIILLSLLLHAHFFVYPPKVIAEPSDGLLYYVFAPLAALPGIVIVIFYQLTVIVAAVRLNYILNELRMFNRSAFTTAMAYVLAVSVFAQWNNLLPALVINIVLIWLFNKVARLYNNSQPKALVYNIGLIAGMIQLLMPSVFTLPVFCLISLAILRPPRPNEWIILLLGIATPFYFAGTVFFLKDDLKAITQFFPYTSFHKLDRILPMNVLLLNGILLGLFTLIGFIIWQNNTARMLIQSRRNWGVLMVLMICLIPCLFVYKGNWLNIALPLMLPVSALASNLFLYPKRAFWPHVFFWSTVAVVVYNNWFLR